MLPDEPGVLGRRAEALRLIEVEHQLARSPGQVVQLDERTRELAALRAGRARDAEARLSLERDLAELQDRLDDTARRLRQLDDSVTWQLFTRVRARTFALLGGEKSLGVGMLQAMLRRLGRVLLGKPKPPEDPAFRPRPIRIPEAENPDVSIVIPLHARADLTDAALRSIVDRTHHYRYEVILVDDSADALTKSLLERVQGARVITNESNLGYLRSVKRGAEAARGRWLVLCNNDIEVHAGWLGALLDCAESRPDIAIVAPKFICPDGSLSEAGGIIWRDGSGANYGRGDDPNSCHYSYRREIDYGSAAALMVRADFWREVGGFDERFEPMYYEDTDLCFEARRRGLLVVYEPQAEVVHAEGGTAGVDEGTGHKRHQAENRPKFVSKWRSMLEGEHLENESRNLWLGANLRRGPRVLVADHRVPTWDRDSGGLRMRSMLEALHELGCHVTVLPDNGVPLQPYTRELQRAGIEVLYGDNLHGKLARIGPSLSLVILSRAEVAGRWLLPVRECARAAPIVFDTVDLHWLREARRAALESGHGENGTALGVKASATRELELALIRATDAASVVTESERDQVMSDVPDASVFVVPNANVICAEVPSPASRQGVVFVGAFEHPPNVNGAVALVNDVMPLVWREHGDVPVTIVGAEPPDVVRALASPRVEVTGWVADLDLVLDSARVLVAPLTYGAGLKGKVTQALCSGLPVVTTPVGAEGLDAIDGEHMLIGENCEALAERTVRVLHDDELWQRLSHMGQQLAADRCSSHVMRDRLQMLLEQLVTVPADQMVGVR